MATRPFFLFFPSSAPYRINTQTRLFGFDFGVKLLKILEFLIHKNRLRRRFMYY